MLTHIYNAARHKFHSYNAARYLGLYSRNVHPYMDALYTMSKAA